MATPTAVHYFDPALDIWIKMKIDSIVELTKPSQRLFFKGLHVTSYPRFNQLFGSVQSHKLNPHLSLSQERGYVKQAWTITKACTVDTLDTVLELSSDEGDDHLSTLSPKKCRRVQPTPSGIDSATL